MLDQSSRRKFTSPLLWLISLYLFVAVAANVWWIVVWLPPDTVYKSAAIGFNTLPLGVLLALSVYANECSESWRNFWRVQPFSGIAATPPYAYVIVGLLMNVLWYGFFFGYVYHLAALGVAVFASGAALATVIVPPQKHKNQALVIILRKQSVLVCWAGSLCLLLGSLATTSWFVHGFGEGWYAAVLFLNLVLVVIPLVGAGFASKLLTRPSLLASAAGPIAPVALCVGILYFVLGLISSGWWFLLRPNARSFFGLLALNIFPGGLLLLIGLVATRWGERKRLIKAICAVLVLTGLPYLVTVNARARGECRFIIDTDPAHYSKYVESDSEYAPDLLSHFPREIPAESTSVSFFRGTTMDLTLLQLRCTLPKNSVTEVLKKYRPVAICIQNGCAAKGPNSPYVFTEFRNADNSDFAQLNEDFLLLVLQVWNGSYGTTDLQCENWQSNYNAGVAVNRKSNEVIYWATYQ